MDSFLGKNIRVVKFHGSRKGKTVSVLAGVHGDEKCGVKAFDNLIPNLKINAGTVYFIYCNLKAIEEDKRYIEKNLNRCFFNEQPLEVRDSLEGKTAREIIPFLLEADAVLDVHASGSENSIPFVGCGQQSFGVAKFLPVDTVVYGWDDFEPGSTDYFMNLQNRIGICIECGYLGDEKSVDVACESIMNFLKVLDNINGNCEKRNQKYIKINGLYRNKFGAFRRARDFADFEILNNGDLIGFDGDIEVRARGRYRLLFVRDRDEINSECFLRAQITT
jgi:predicted deacylase